MGGEENGKGEQRKWKVVEGKAVGKGNGAMVVGGKLDAPGHN